jgi:hypothetical protein
MTTDRPKLGAAFRGDRSSDLAGLLPTASPARPVPSVRMAEPEEMNAPVEPGLAESNHSLATTREPAAPRARASRRKPASDEVRLIPVSVDISIHAKLRATAAQHEQTYAQVVIAAIEDHAKHLMQHWRRSPSPSTGGRLFASANHSHKPRRNEPGVQIQLRLSSTDAATLDRLVAEWEAPSRSALVNEALHRHVGLD